MDQKKSWIEMVKEFQRTFDAQNVSSDKHRLDSMDALQALELIALRWRLVAEEFGEFAQAMLELMKCFLAVPLTTEQLGELYHGRGSHVIPVLGQMGSVIEQLGVGDAKYRGKTAAKRECLDAMGDEIWVIIGTALSFGLDLDEALRRIHASNMSKLGRDGKVITRDDGKILKGPDYRPPVLDDLV
ncbi:nucleoside triphosphate pyrophosphohydrolase family protein [Pyramidobacter piscolens]|uniref:nucleoside triphosphate pyrophosphohydrolase family protein n=1 Tax=Pyramidobacter piscolens TaxID=638849 RepID=UPI0024915AA6|nr:nucleoside triphosphate pyrophosphohydrolase family protein [Pyramidobacter piscolens]